LGCLGCISASIERDRETTIDRLGELRAFTTNARGGINSKTTYREGKINVFILKRRGSPHKGKEQHRFKPMTATAMFASCAQRRFYIRPGARPNWAWQPNRDFIERSHDGAEVMS
jgi:hypothetical protein